MLKEAMPFNAESFLHHYEKLVDKYTLINTNVTWYQSKVRTNDKGLRKEGISERLAMNTPS